MDKENKCTFGKGPIEMSGDQVELHKLHNFINPFDQFSKYVLFTNGLTEEFTFSRKTHLPNQLYTIQTWKGFKKLEQKFVPSSDGYILPFSPLSKSRVSRKVLPVEFVEYIKIYDYFHSIAKQHKRRQQRMETLITISMLLAENYDLNFNGVPRGIKWIAAKLGTNSRKITHCLHDLAELELIRFHQEKAEKDKITLTCFIELTELFLKTFTSYFRNNDKYQIFQMSAEKLTLQEPNYHLYGKKGHFWFQNQENTLKVRLQQLLRDPEVDAEVKLHVYKVLL